jgi:apolipoprotein N-acyltransferase
MVQGVTHRGDWVLNGALGLGAAPKVEGLAISHWLYVLIAAALQAASAAWPWDVGFAHGQPLWWLQVVALVTFVWQLSRCTNLRQAALTGLVFTSVWLTGTFWWLYGSMHTYGGLNAVVAGLAVLGLAVALALYYAVACAVYWRLARHRSAALVFAVLWVMAEMARGTWLTGFGWGAIAYAHTNGPLAGFAPWVGAYGMVAIAAWVAAALVATLRGSIAHGLGVVLVLGAGLLAPLVHWSSPAGTLSVTLLQGNIAQDEKFELGSGVPVALAWYGQQLAANTSDLVVAPETAIPLLPQDLPDRYWDRLQTHFQAGNQAALIGIPLGSYTQGYTNSVVGLRPGETQTWRYDKHHLVPFGEFIPPLFKWFTQLMNIPLGDFNRGAVGQASMPWKGQRLAPNICYEDLFGEELGARFTDPAVAPTIFVNASNIGWFGNTVAIDQHLQISRLRALEFERPMLRATNTGATVVIDHTGAVTAALPRHTQGVLESTVQGRTGITPYAWWVSRGGLWPIWLLAIAIVFVAARARPVSAQ